VHHVGHLPRIKGGYVVSVPISAVEVETRNVFFLCSFYSKVNSHIY